MEEKKIKKILIVLMVITILNIIILLMLAYWMYKMQLEINQIYVILHDMSFQLKEFVVLFKSIVRLKRN